MHCNEQPPRTGNGLSQYPGDVFTRAREYIKKHGITNISILKIDVEGMEYDVIKGCDEYLDICDVITFEYSNMLGNKYGKIKELLPNFNFNLINPDGSLTNIDSGGLVGINYGNIVCIKKWM